MQENNKEIIKKSELIANRKKRIFWIVLFVCIAILSIIAITGFNKNFSLTMFLSYLHDASFGWLFIAILCVFGFILFEGLSIYTVCKSFGYKGKKCGFVYSAADIYFSAITPSASGGQPASAYFMLKDGIPLSIITVSLLYTLLMYSVSIIILVLIGILIHPFLFFQLDFLSKIFIFIGFIVQFFLIVCFYCLLYKEKLLTRICHFGLKILSKFHLIKKIDTKIEKLNEVMDKYQESASLIKGKKSVLIKVFLYNLLQRVSQIGVILFVFLASGGNLKDISLIFTIQSLVIMGAYSAPIPGAIGVTDYLMIHGFERIMFIDHAVNLELLSRGLSFYLCILICGIVILIKYFMKKRSSKNDRSL